MASSISKVRSLVSVLALCASVSGVSASAQTGQRTSAPPLADPDSVAAQVAGTASNASAGANAGANAVVHVEGRVVKPGDPSMVRMPHLMVTLHRVGSDTAGPVDSVRSAADGSYRFTYRRTGANDAVYFAAATYGGVAYFSAPFKAGMAPTTDDAEITVFDTTSKPVPISVRGRHLVVGALEARGNRRVTEVFELSNDTSVTRVASSDAPSGASWSVDLPPMATRPEVPEGDIPSGAVQFANGRALVYAPMGPGVKQLVVSYLLPETAFPLELTVHDPVSVLEVLLEEPTATVSGASLKAMGAVPLGGRKFQRFLGDNTPANTMVRIAVPGSPQPISPWFMAGLTMVIGGAMVGTLAYALRRRR